jgi:hypothetical protein
MSLLKTTLTLQIRLEDLIITNNFFLLVSKTKCITLRKSIKALLISYHCSPAKVYHV